MLLFSELTMEAHLFFQLALEFLPAQQHEQASSEFAKPCHRVPHLQAGSEDQSGVD
jgi:hypothetical protein